jgi:hypothetical protein
VDDLTVISGAFPQRITCIYCLILEGLDKRIGNKCPYCRAVSFSLSGSKYWAVRLTRVSSNFSAALNLDIVDHFCKEVEMEFY